jgi:antitoxin component YwqK of YwqJK toxin-antitoxin module
MVIHDTNKGPTINGVRKTYHSNKQVYSEVTYVNGLRNGIYRTWDYTGYMLNEGIFKNGLRHGVTSFYLKDGSLQCKEHHIKNIIEGEYLTFKY